MKKKRFKLWLLSVVAGFLGMIVGTMISAPVFVDSFQAQRPPTFSDILIPNLIVTLPYALVPGLLVLLVGWAIHKARSSN